MEFIQIAAILYILITVVVIFFQLFLVLGAPWGEFTQGGRHKGSLPISGRISAAISIPILVFMASSISSVVGFVPNWSIRTAYITLALQGVTAVFNLITPSLKERRLWGPVTTIAFILAAYSTFSS
tara:strand:+ start:624 stop:1001 length:378 start_codon:yes stop_codon:yes gene_type:complete